MGQPGGLADCCAMIRRGDQVNEVNSTYTMNEMVQHLRESESVQIKLTDPDCIPVWAAPYAACVSRSSSPIRASRDVSAHHHRGAGWRDNAYIRSGTEARKRKSEGKRNFNNTLKLSVSEQAHRKEALAEVYYMFDLDGDGSVSEEEMMRIGQARKELGGRGGDWTCEMNKELMQEISELDWVAGKLVVQLENFVEYYNERLSVGTLEFGEAIDRFKQEALRTQMSKEEAARSKVTASVNIEIPAASRQSKSTAPSRRDISTASIDVKANAREVTAREQNIMAVEKRQQALVAKKKAAALKEAQELAAENAAKEARFAEREAKLEARQKSKEDSNTPEETKFAAREATLKAKQKPKAAEQSQPRRKSISGRVKSNKEI